MNFHAEIGSHSVRSPQVTRMTVSMRTVRRRRRTGRHAQKTAALRRRKMRKAVLRTGKNTVLLILRLRTGKNQKTSQ